LSTNVALNPFEVLVAGGLALYDRQVRTACGSGRLIFSRSSGKLDQPPATAGGSDSIAGLFFFLSPNPSLILRLLHDLLRQLSGNRIVMRELHVE